MSATLSGTLFRGVWAEGGNSPVCRFENSPNKVTRLICDLPDCLTGKDCVPPKILSADAVIEKSRTQNWIPNCRPTFTSGCWLAVFPLRARIQAEDESGISEVGVEIEWITGKKSVTRKIWGPALKKDTLGRFDFSSDWKELVPAEAKVQIKLKAYCARDKAGNETCEANSITRN
jgi:hypothetical protein